MLYKSRSSADVQRGSCALKWFWKSGASTKPADSVLVSTLLEEIRRDGTPPTHRKKISPEDIRRFADWEPDSLKDRRIKTLLALLFAACLRPAEGINLRRDAVEFTSSHMVVSTVKDKTQARVDKSRARTGH
uniref:Tyr recombinase domain-containing protein n=1 Tax=Steinernema glaseri TaxID=37863 RepID=A0A1I7YX60_9BILA